MVIIFCVGLLISVIPGLSVSFRNAMTKNWYDRCVKIVVYYVIFSNILLPMVLLFINDPNSCISFSDILTSIVWIVSGVLLLIGTLQGKEKYVRIYVMLTTVCLLLGPIYVTLYPGDGAFCEKRNTITMILLFLYFIMMWPFQYCIYLFYKQMAQVDEAIPSHKQAEEGNISLLDVPKNGNQQSEAV